MHKIVYDGTFIGLLTAVFEIYEYKFQDPDIKKEEFANTSLFENFHTVISNATKANRVILKLQSLLPSSSLLKLKYAFLSELAFVENNLFQYIKYAIDKKVNIENDFSNKYVLAIEGAARKTSREAHRMKGFVRFQLSGDGLYFATIQPDHNILPIISKHFKDRFASQKWLIYDLNRKYGIYYDLSGIVEVNIEMKTSHDEDGVGMVLHEDETNYQNLWKQYFKSTNIAARKNTKLHIQQLPRRYWKHLTEKMIE